MATLADSGSTQVSENNPYQLAMNNEAQLGMAGKGGGLSEPAGTPPPISSSMTPAAVSQYQSLMASDPSYVSRGKGTPVLYGPQPSTPDESVANTPEAASPSDAASQLAAADQAQIKKDQASKSGAAAPIVPTEQQDVNAALQPDISALDQLPDEYKAVMAQLAPYIGGGQNTGNAALNAADKNVASTIDSTNGPIEKALGGLSKATKEYAGTVPYQGIVQALLGFGKYEETYAGAQPQNQSDWTQSMDQIYQYLSGANASSNGLPSPVSAAATIPTTAGSSSDSAGGGNG